jgi:hypothetical protein
MTAAQHHLDQAAWHLQQAGNIMAGEPAECVARALRWTGRAEGLMDNPPAPSFSSTPGPAIPTNPPAENAVSLDASMAVLDREDPDLVAVTPRLLLHVKTRRLYRSAGRRAWRCDYPLPTTFASPQTVTLCSLLSPDAPAPMPTGDGNNPDVAPENPSAHGDGPDHVASACARKPTQQRGSERGNDSGDDVFTMGVDEEFTVKFVGAVGRVAGEGNSGAGGFAGGGLILAGSRVSSRSLTGQPNKVTVTSP